MPCSNKCVEQTAEGGTTHAGLSHVASTYSSEQAMDGGGAPWASVAGTAAQHTGATQGVVLVGRMPGKAEDMDMEDTVVTVAMEDVAFREGVVGETGASELTRFAWSMLRPSTAPWVSWELACFHELVIGNH